jgi:hypothetical protein
MKAEVVFAKPTKKENLNEPKRPFHPALPGRRGAVSRVINPGDWILAAG